MSGGQELGPQFVRRWVGCTAEGVHDQRNFLTQLDAAIGDADHGVNMDRGLFAAIAKLDDSADDGTVQILETVGSTLILSVGGAAGPLYGSAFRQMGRTLGDTETFDPEDLLSALRAGLEEIQRLGAATVGSGFAPTQGLRRDPCGRSSSRWRSAFGRARCPSTPR